eukprot:COSAG06_NODE_568_length_14183_cov_130.573843_2_plen_92_part_00
MDPGGGGPVGVRGSVWVGVGEEPTKRLYYTQRAGLECQGLVVVSVGAGCASTWRHRLVKRLRNFQFVDSVISVHVCFALGLDLLWILGTHG